MADIKPTTSALGSGQAARAAKAMQDAPYRMHVEESKALAQEPMEYDEWQKMHGNIDPKTGKPK